MQWFKFKTVLASTCGAYEIHTFSGDSKYLLFIDGKNSGIFDTQAHAKQEASRHANKKDTDRFIKEFRQGNKSNTKHGR